jgi:alpha-tubulin suppressor-like RCC1 family protein
VKQVTCGPFHTLVLTSKGRVFSSGLKLNGDLSSSEYSVEFTEFKLRTSGVGYIEQISSALTLNAARTSEGRVYVWGVFNETLLSEPTLVEVRIVIEVSLGGEYQCLLTAKSEVYQLYSDES